jgi:hypothetical protein
MILLQIKKYNIFFENFFGTSEDGVIADISNGEQA